MNDQEHAQDAIKKSSQISVSNLAIYIHNIAGGYTPYYLMYTPDLFNAILDEVNRSCECTSVIGGTSLYVYKGV